MLPGEPPVSRRPRAALPGSPREALQEGMSGTPERFLVPPALAGERLDRVLASLLGGLPRAHVREIIEGGHVRVGGLPVTRAARRVESGETLEVEVVPRERGRSAERPELELRVVHEDEHLVVVDKPAGMVAHPGPNLRGGTVAELAAERWGTLPVLQGLRGEDEEGAVERGGIVHRLDADTSGLMVLARTETAGVRLVEQFRAREVTKLYKALVHGEPRFEQDWIEAPIGRHPKYRERMAVVAEGEGREAATFYEVVDRLGAWAWLSVRPTTGRTHQIRVHLTHVHHPLVGDRLYRERSTPPLPERAPPLERHALHAASLAFAHPVTGERLFVEAPLPPDLERLLSWMRARKNLT